MDLWLHLASGRYIVQNLEIPKIDIFSSTLIGQPWNNHEWLFQIIIYKIHSWGGFDGLIYLRIGIVLLTMLLLFGISFKRERQLIPIISLFMVLLVYQYRLILRPDSFSTLFFVVYLMILFLFIERKWSIWVLGFIQLLWVNIHGFFIFGPFLIGLVLISDWIKRRVPLPYEWNQNGRLSDQAHKTLIIALPIVCLVCLINPHTIQGALYPLKVMFSLKGHSQVFFESIGELHKPITWSTLSSGGRYPYFGWMIFISFFTFVLSRKKLDITSLMLWIVFLIFSLNASRNMIFFGIAAYFAIITNMNTFVFSRSLPGSFLNKKYQDLGAIIVKIFLICWMFQLIHGLSFRGYFDFDKMERKSEFGGVSQRNYPTKAVDFLNANNIRGKFFNDFNSGAYLLGRSYPLIKVFIDGRTEVYGPEYFNNYRKIWKGDGDLFDQYAEKYGLTGAFLNSVYVPAPEGIIRHLYRHNDWKLVYFDYDAAIFLKDIAMNQKWIDQWSIDLKTWEPEGIDLAKIGLKRVTPYQNLNRAQALYHLGFYSKAEQEALKAVEILPDYAAAYKMLGKTAIQKEDYKKAYIQLRKAKLLDPSDVETRFYIAKSLTYLGQLLKAEALSKNVLASNSQNHKALFLLTLIYAKQKQYDQLFNYLEKALKENPNEVDYILEIIGVLKRENAADVAKKVLSVALQFNPENQNKFAPLVK